MNRHWNGILIEPIPELFDTLIKKNRKSFSINACIAQSKPMIAEFQIGSAWSGREDIMNDYQKKVIKEQYEPVKRVVNVPCFSLNTIMKV